MFKPSRNFRIARFRRQPGRHSPIRATKWLWKVVPRSKAEISKRPRCSPSCKETSPPEKTPRQHGRVRHNRRGRCQPEDGLQAVVQSGRSGTVVRDPGTQHAHPRNQVSNVKGSGTSGQPTSQGPNSLQIPPHKPKRQHALQGPENQNTPTLRTERHRHPGNGSY